MKEQIINNQIENFDITKKFISEDEIGKNFYSTKKEESFSNFISKTNINNGNFKSASFEIPSHVEFFGRSLAKFQSPIMERATLLKGVNTSSIVLPGLVGYDSGDSQGAAPAGGWGLDQRHRNDDIELKMESVFVKTKVDERYADFSSEYVKAALGMGLVHIQNKAFIQGHLSIRGVSQDSTNKNAVLAPILAALAGNAKIIAQLSTLIDELNPMFRNNACFVISSTMMGLIRSAVDAQGRFIFDQSSQTLLGYKVIVLNEVAIPGAAGAAAVKKIFFGDLSAYVIAEGETKVFLQSDIQNPTKVNVNLVASYGAKLADAQAIVYANE